MDNKKVHYYKGLEAFTLENHDLKLTILPTMGLKIASLFVKEKEFELVFQPTDDNYKQADYGSDFSEYDTSGIDDCLPTIDACKYKDGFILPDHGEVWSSRFEIISHDSNSIKGKLKLKSIPLEFTKGIVLKDSKVTINYSVKNLDNIDHYYLWAFHGLNNYNMDTELIFPDEYKDYINVQNDETWDFDIKKLANFKKDKTYKYYFTNELEEGWAGLDHKNSKIKYIINFDTKMNPYLGVWLTTGGFKNEKNVAIEPCNGFYDSLEKAISLGKAKSIEANKHHDWSINLDIINY